MSCTRFTSKDATTVSPSKCKTVHRFISEQLAVSPHDCVWFYNIKGAIQCHTPLVVGIEEFKGIGRCARDFSDGLNPNIYSRKQQYALPWIRSKSEVEIGWDTNDMRRASQRDNPTFDSYEAILALLFDVAVLPEPGPEWEPSTSDPEPDSDYEDCFADEIVHMAIERCMDADGEYPTKKRLAEECRGMTASTYAEAISWAVNMRHAVDEQFWLNRAFMGGNHHVYYPVSEPNPEEAVSIHP